VRLVAFDDRLADAARKEQLAVDGAARLTS